MSGRSGQVAVRRARMDDAARLAALCRQLGYPASQARIRRRLRRILGRLDHAVFVARETGRALLGWVHVHRRELLEEDPQAEIEGLVVDVGHRGRGVGRLLTERAEAWARSRGCGAVRLRTNVIRTGAHRFYAALGYRHLKTQRVYRRILRRRPEARG